MIRNKYKTQNEIKPVKKKNLSKSLNPHLLQRAKPTLRKLQSSLHYNLLPHCLQIDFELEHFHLKIWFRAAATLAGILNARMPDFLKV